MKTPWDLRKTYFEARKNEKNSRHFHNNHIAAWYILGQGFPNWGARTPGGCVSPSQGVRETFLNVKTRVRFVEIKSECDKIINTLYWHYGISCHTRKYVYIKCIIYKKYHIIYHIIYMNIMSAYYSRIINQIVFRKVGGSWTPHRGFGEIKLGNPCSGALWHIIYVVFLLSFSYNFITQY